MDEVAPRRWRAWTVRAPLLLDAALAVSVTALGLISMQVAAGATEGVRRPDAVGVALVVLSGLPVAARSRAPLVALALALPSSLAVFALGYSQVNGGVGALLCLYSVAALHPYRWSVPAWLVSAAAVLAVLSLAAPPAAQVGLADLAANQLAVALFWGAGAWARSRQRYVRGLEERNAALEAARRSEARTALVEARGAVARDLQDLVGHAVMAAVVQASAARRLVRVDPSSAERAMAEVERLGREAAAEVRRALGVLEVDAAVPSTRPQPSVQDLPDLVAAARDAGLDVEMEGSPSAVAMQPGPSLAAYRVVEEALRNARHHAGPARVKVRVADGGDSVRLAVEDDGRGAVAWAEGVGGAGLLALQERVASYGGRVEAGPRRGGGYAVTAVLPGTSRDVVEEPA